MLRRRPAVFAATLFATAVLAAPAAAAVPHTVEPGETLWSIAAINAMPVQALAAANGISPETQVEAGATILIPPGGGSVTQAAPAPSAPAAAPSAGGQVSPALIGDVAESQGVPRELGQAVAWQESGFNNGVVSSAGAQGVMQVMPGTWDFIESSLGTGPLEPGSAEANVRAGMTYLGHLIRLKGSESEAVAAYFQGPARSGWLPETEDYVEAVGAHRAEFTQP